MITDKIEKIINYAQLCKLVYEKKDDKKLTDSKQQVLNTWQEIIIPGVKFEYSYDSEDGKSALMKAKIFKKNKEVVIAFKGTTISNLDDLKNDLWIALGNKAPRFKEAERYVANIIQYFKNQRGKLFCCHSIHIIITGHSLGGAIAQWLSMKMSLEAYTFESPGIMNEMKHQYNKKKCHNFLSDPNLVNTCNIHFGIIYYVMVPKTTKYIEYLRHNIVQASRKIAECSSETSSDFFESMGFSSTIFPKILVKAAIQKGIESLVGKNLINHSLYTHQLDYMIENLSKKYAKIKLVQQWPTFNKILEQIGIEINKPPTTLSELIALITKLEGITHHISNLDQQLIALIQYTETTTYHRECSIL